jgi:hypothetical protein
MEVLYHGLYLNGKKYPTEGDEFIYVLTNDHRLRPVRGLTASEVRTLKSVTPDVDLTTLAVWREKVEPVIDEEFERGRIFYLRQGLGEDFERLYPEEAELARQWAAEEADRKDSRPRSPPAD